MLPYKKKRTLSKLSAWSAGGQATVCVLVLALVGSSVCGAVKTRPTRLARVVAKQIYQELTTHGVVTVRETLDPLAVKYYQEGFPDRRMVAELRDCLSCVVVQRGLDLLVYRRKHSVRLPRQQQWKIERDLGELLEVSEVDSGERYLLLKSDPGTQSPEIEAVIEDTDVGWLVKTPYGDLQLVLNKDPSIGPLGTFQASKERIGKSWLVKDKAGAQRLILKSDSSKRSLWFETLVRDFGNAWLVEDRNGAQLFVLKSDPSVRSPSFTKTLEERADRVLVGDAGKRYWISMQDLGVQEEPSAP